MALSRLKLEFESPWGHLTTRRKGRMNLLFFVLATTRGFCTIDYAGIDVARPRNSRGSDGATGAKTTAPANRKLPAQEFTGAGRTSDGNLRESKSCRPAHASESIRWRLETGTMVPPPR